MSMSNVSPDSSILTGHMLEMFSSGRDPVDYDGNAYSRLLPCDADGHFTDHSFTELMEN